jgi:hypothetical protein
MVVPLFVNGTKLPVHKQNNSIEYIAGYR